MTHADVIISKAPTGLVEVRLVKGERLLKSIRFMKAEWENLQKQVSAHSAPDKSTKPIDVVVAKYQRLHNAGVNCMPIPSLLEDIRKARMGPDEMVRKEKLEVMMERLSK